MQQLGGLGGVMGMLPGIGKLKSQIADSNLDDKVLKRQRAIISSMTPKERRSPRLIDGKRRRRIAAGSGTKVEDVNRLLKMHRQMADMMKAMGRNKGLMGRMFGGMGGMGGGMPQPTPEQLAALQKGQVPKGMELPKGLPGGLPKALPGLGGGLPGLGGPRIPGLPGIPGKKK
jgi:signal recognition particle subunit SRP54